MKIRYHLTHNYPLKLKFNSVHSNHSAIQLTGFDQQNASQLCSLRHRIQIMQCDGLTGRKSCMSLAIVVTFILTASFIKYNDQI